MCSALASDCAAMIAPWTRLDQTVNQETRIMLVVNLQAAKALGISIPRDFLQRVDEVIQ